MGSFLLAVEISRSWRKWHSGINEISFQPTRSFPPSGVETSRQKASVAMKRRGDPDRAFYWHCALLWLLVDNQCCGRLACGEDNMGSDSGSKSCGIDADAVLYQLGQAGRFHLRVYALVALAAVQVGLLHTTYIFLAADVPYR
ncbi:hypothetical protein ACJJTC_007236 [Scirpophaga incertulas]